MSDASVLETHIRYYRARAPEYDEWFFRRGRAASTAPAAHDPRLAWLREIHGTRLHLRLCSAPWNYFERSVAASGRTLASCATRPIEKAATPGGKLP